MTPVFYPTEDVSQDTAYFVLEIVNGNTVQIDCGDKLTTVRLTGLDISEIPTSKSIDEKRSSLYPICYLGSLYISALAAWTK